MTTIYIGHLSVKQGLFIVRWFSPNSGSAIIFNTDKDVGILCFVNSCLNGFIRFYTMPWKSELRLPPDLPIMHWAYVVFMYFLGCYKTVMQSSAVVHVHHGISHLSLVFFGIHTSSTLLGKYKWLVGYAMVNVYHSKALHTVISIYTSGPGSVVQSPIKLTQG